jgi:putative spermidine/putrescine transport system permease protein
MAPGRRGGAAAYVALLVVGGCALVPLAIVAVSSIASQWFWPALLPGQWTSRAWRYALGGRGGIAAALATSLSLALVVAVAAVAMALPAARALALYEFRGKHLLLFGLLVPMLAPPLAAAMGLHTVFLRAGLSDSVAGVALVHLVQAGPYATLMLAGTFSNFDTDYEAQARTLGARPWLVWTRITLPAIAPGLAVAAMLAFLVSWSQYVLTLVVGGGQVLTLPLLLVAFQRGGDEAVAAALAIVFVAPALALFGVMAPLLEDA